MRWPARRSPDAAQRRIAAGLRRGDPDALRDLHEALAPTVFGFLCRALPDRATAEDACQQVFAEVWRRGAQYDPRRSSLTTWVMMIARSRATDELRRRVPVPHDPALLPETGHADAAVESLADRWRVAALLRVLPQGDAELLRMRFYDGLSQTEISDATGLTLGTVKTRMVRGMERLRELLEAEDARTAAVLDAARPRTVVAA